MEKEKNEIIIELNKEIEDWKDKNKKLEEENKLIKEKFENSSLDWNLKYKDLDDKIKKKMLE